MSLKDIEKSTLEYSEARRLLSGDVQKLQLRIERLRRAAMPGIRRRVDAATRRKEKLQTLIEDNKGLFGKPKTYTFDGVKVGLHKGKGKLEFDNEQAVIVRIEKELSKDQVQLLVKITKKLVKKACDKLDVATLKKIGVTITAAGDQVLIAGTDDALDKAVTALLEEGQQKSESEEGDE